LGLVRLEIEKKRDEAWLRVIITPVLDGENGKLNTVFLTL